MISLFLLRDIWIYSSSALLQFCTRLASDPSSRVIREAFLTSLTKQLYLLLLLYILFFFFIEIKQLSVLKKQGMHLCLYLLIWMNDSCLRQKIQTAKIYPDDFHFQEAGVDILFQIQLKTLGIIHKTNMKILIGEEKAKQQNFRIQRMMTWWWVLWVFISLHIIQNECWNSWQPGNVNRHWQKKVQQKSTPLSKRTRKGAA